MKTNSICDDKLISIVGTELSRIGIFVPISEVEQSAVLIYARLREAFAKGTGAFTIDSSIKSDIYYDFLSSAIIVELISKTRLKQVRNGFELNSTLCLLDSYLHKLSNVSGAQNFKASSIFSDVIIALPPEATIMGTKPNVEFQQHDWGITMVPKCNQQCTDCYEEPTLCNNCETGDECFDTVNMTIEYCGTCFGFRVDPELLGLDKPLEECDVQVFKNFIKQGAKLFIKEADKVFMQIYRQHEEFSDED